MLLVSEQLDSFIYATFDIWNEKVFYQGQEFPAGYFAASILNVSDDEMNELLRRGGAPTFSLPSVIQGGDREAALAFPALREQIRDLVKLLWRYPPFCYNNLERELALVDELFHDIVFPSIREPYSEFQEEFLKYITGITRIPLAIINFAAAGRYFEAGYLQRLKERTESSFAAAANDCFNSKWFWDMMRKLPQPRVFQGKDVETFSMYPGTLCVNDTE